MTEKELKELHKHSIFNEEEIKKSTVCGCFYCGTVLNVKDIDELYASKNGKVSSQVAQMLKDGE